MFQGDAFQRDSFQDDPPQVHQGASIFVVNYVQQRIQPPTISNLYLTNPATDRAPYDAGSNIFVVNYDWYGAPIQASYLYSFNPARDVPGASTTSLSATSNLAVASSASAPTGKLGLLGTAASLIKEQSSAPTGKVGLHGELAADGKAQSALPTGKVGLSGVATVDTEARTSAPTGKLGLLGIVASFIKQQGGALGQFALTARLKIQDVAFATAAAAGALTGRVAVNSRARGSAPTAKLSLSARTVSGTSVSFGAPSTPETENGASIFVINYVQQRIQPAAISRNYIQCQATDLPPRDGGSSILVVNYDWPAAPIKASYLYSFNTAQDRITNVESDPHFIGRFTPTKLWTNAALRHNTAQDPPPVITAPLTGLATAQSKSQAGITAPAPEANPHFLGDFTDTVFGLLGLYRQGGADGSVVGLAGRVAAALKSNQLPFNTSTGGPATGESPSNMFVVGYVQQRIQPASIASTYLHSPATDFAQVTFSTSSSPFVVAYEWPSAPIKASYLYSFNSAQDVPPVTGPLAITGRIAALLKSAPAGISTPEANPHFLGQYTGPIFSLLGLLRQGGADAPPIVETNPHYIGRYTPMQLRLLTALRQNNSTDHTFGFASLSGRAGVAVKTRPNTSAKLVLSGRASTLFKQLRTVFHASFPLAGVVKIGGVISHNATSGTLTLLARATALVNALAQPSGKLGLIGRSSLTAQANALRSGIANLLGRASTAVMDMASVPVGDLILTASALTLQAVIHGNPGYIGSLLSLLSTGAAQVKARANLGSKIGLFGVASAVATAQSDLGVFFALVASLRSQSEANASATGTATLSSLASIATKIRPHSIPIAVMFGRVATASKSLLATVANFPLIARLTTAVSSLAAPVGTATLNATSTLASKFKPSIIGKIAFTARTVFQTIVRAKVVNTIELASIIAAKLKANTSYTLNATLSAFSQSQTKTVRPYLAGKAQMLAATAFQTTAGNIATGKAVLIAALATAMAKLRSAAPQGTVGLTAQVGAVTKTFLGKSRGLVLQAAMALGAAARAIAPRIVIRLFSDRDYITAPNTMTPASSVYSTPSTWRVLVTVPAKPSPSMPQGRDFSPIDPGETITGTFDFARWLSSGAQIQSVTSVTCAVATSSNYSDASASSRIVGAPQIGPSPFSGLPNVCVLQQWGGMVPNVLYVMTAVVVTTDGQTLKLWAHQPCGASN